MFEFFLRSPPRTPFSLNARLSLPHSGEFSLSSITGIPMGTSNSIKPQLNKSPFPYCSSFQGSLYRWITSSFRRTQKPWSDLQRLHLKSSSTSPTTTFCTIWLLSRAFQFHLPKDVCYWSAIALANVLSLLISISFMNPLQFCLTALKHMSVTALPRAWSISPLKSILLSLSSDPSVLLPAACLSSYSQLY